MIKYISTRAKAPVLSFEEAVLTGLASDGGLYVPDSLPHFAPHELVEMAGLSYTELAFRIMQPFIGKSIPEKDLRKLLEDSYKDFRHSAIAPLKQLGHNEYLLELFHGPTLAFKDFALQFLGRVLEYFITRRKQKLTIIGATSGDTGSAAIEGCRGRKNMRIFILHPEGRVTNVQRRQMTTLPDKNIFNLAIKGTFDDCQDIVKSLFSDVDFCAKQKLTAINSINWARVLAQTVYYFYAALAVGAPAKRVSFSVPTGNFGDIYAGYLAAKMGLPIERLIIATNKNDILARCLKTSVYSAKSVTHTISPSMDIQVASNFERLLFDLHNRDGGAIARLMQDFRKNRKFTLPAAALKDFRLRFAADSADDNATRKTIASVFKNTGELVDPHTAVGIAVGRKFADPATPLITLSTASPAKFPDVVKEVTGVHPKLPAHLDGLLKRKERMKKLPNDIRAVQKFIENPS